MPDPRVIDLGEFGKYVLSGAHSLTSSPIGNPEITLPGRIRVGNDFQARGMVTPWEDALSAARQMGVPENLMQIVAERFRGYPLTLYGSDPSDSTKQHERIHAGQYLSGYHPQEVTTDELNLFRKLRDLALAKKNPYDDGWAFELPAYAFHGGNPETQTLFNEYMRNARLASKNPEFLELAMPPNLLNTMMRYAPVPYTKMPPLPPGLEPPPRRE